MRHFTAPAHPILPTSRVFENRAGQLDGHGNFRYTKPHHAARVTQLCQITRSTAVRVVLHPFAQLLSHTPNVTVAIVLASLLLLGFAVLFYSSLRRASELFVLHVDSEAEPRVTFVRGRIPPALWDDLLTVLAASNAKGRVRVVVSRGSAVVETRGSFSAETVQRVRNVVGLYPLAKLRN